MKGIELSEKFYRDFGEPMLHNEFPEWEHLIAVGLMGSGSECFGYDDEISRDHDFEPGFCLFIPDEDLIDKSTAFALEKAYSKLPKAFMGYKRNFLAPVGGNRHGVIRISEFFKSKTGTSDGSLSMKDWFFIPEQSLAEATNGKIFRDDLGKLTEIREKILYMPEDVRLKKLAGNILIMGQSGQYNYKRCVLRGETAAAQLALAEFVKSTLNVAFLLNKKYIPYYKWSFYALRNLQTLSSIYEPLEYLISSGNNEEEITRKEYIIEQICSDVITELKNQKITQFHGAQMEGHAYSVNDRISDAEIRNLHILYGV